ncbi:MAG: ArsC family reductase [Gammaproteobacteria bacterium]
MLTLYGIKNCDTVKKARRWLDAHAVDYRFHDLRSDGLDAARLKQWIKLVGWETLLNTRGTTWRQLSARDKRDLTEASASKLMLAYPTLVKRPVVEHGQAIVVGFNDDDYAARFC